MYIGYIYNMSDSFLHKGTIKDGKERIS